MCVWQMGEQGAALRKLFLSQMRGETFRWVTHCNKGGVCVFWLHTFTCLIPASTLQSVTGTQLWRQHIRNDTKLIPQARMHAGNAEISLLLSYSCCFSSDAMLALSDVFPRLLWNNTMTNRQQWLHFACILKNFRPFVDASVAKRSGDLQKSIFILLIVLIWSSALSVFHIFYVHLENYKTVQD